MKYDRIQSSTVEQSAIECSIVQLRIVQCITVHNNTIQYNTIQYNTTQYSTAQYSMKIMLVYLHHLFSFLVFLVKMRLVQLFQAKQVITQLLNFLLLTQSNVIKNDRISLFYFLNDRISLFYFFSSEVISLI